MGATNMIEVRHLSKTFGDVKAVDDISFDVARGEIFAFSGSQGFSGRGPMMCSERGR